MIQSFFDLPPGHVMAMFERCLGHSLEEYWDWYTGFQTGKFVTELLPDFKKGMELRTAVEAAYGEEAALAVSMAVLHEVKTALDQTTKELYFLERRGA